VKIWIFYLSGFGFELFTCLIFFPFFSTGQRGTVFSDGDVGYLKYKWENRRFAPWVLLAIQKWRQRLWMFASLSLLHISLSLQKKSF